MTKQYPDRNFEKYVRAQGVDCRLMWEEKGPKNTGISWISGYHVGQGICIVQSFKDGGWEVYTALPENNISASVADALARCGVKEMQPA